MSEHNVKPRKICHNSIPFTFPYFSVFQSYRITKEINEYEEEYVSFENIYFLNMNLPF